MKKFSLSNYITKRKVLEFLDRKGFYIVLFLCIGIITVTAYTVTKRNLSSFNDTTAFDELAQETTKPDARATLNNKPAKSQDAAVNKKTDKDKQKQTAVADKTAQASKGQVKAETKEADKPKQVRNLQFPVLGQVTMDFAKTYLVYSKTLEQWTTHDGIDIGADRGTPVKAAQDGVVSEVYTDAKYGITVVLDHGDGYKTRYANLSTDSMVKKGAKIIKGQTISGIGNTAVFETGEQPHLHFEVIQNGVNINPKSVIK